jgi:hypothetical protein
MLYTKDTHIFATMDCTLGREEAREYIERMKLTPANAKMVSRDGVISVVLKEDTEI